jgi:hypothetical protein
LCHNYTYGPFAELVTQEGAHDIIVTRPWKPVEIDVFGIDRNLSCRFGIQGGSKRGRKRLKPSAIGIRLIEDQHRSGQGLRRNQWRQNRKRNYQPPPAKSDIHVKIAWRGVYHTTTENWVGPTANGLMPNLQEGLMSALGQKRTFALQ